MSRNLVQESAALVVGFVVDALAAAAEGLRSAVIVVFPSICWEACHFDVAGGPFKWLGNALMWLCGTLKNPFRTLKKFSKKTERVNKAYCDVLVQCQ